MAFVLRDVEDADVINTPFIARSALWGHMWITILIDNFIAAAAAECTSALCTGADSISPSVANFLYGVFCTLPGGIKGTALTCCG